MTELERLNLAIHMFQGTLDWLRDQRDELRMNDAVASASDYAGLNQAIIECGNENAGLNLPPLFKDRLNGLILQHSRKINQATLAKRCGVTPSAVAQWRAGLTVPSNPAALKLAEFFNVPVEYIIK